MQYDEFNPFDICPETYTPIYRGQENECCPFCGAKYSLITGARALIIDDRESADEEGDVLISPFNLPETPMGTRPSRL